MTYDLRVGARTAVCLSVRVQVRVRVCVHRVLLFHLAPPWSWTQRSRGTAASPHGSARWPPDSGHGSIKRGDGSRETSPGHGKRDCPDYTRHQCSEDDKSLIPHLQSCERGPGALLGGTATRL